MKKIFTLLSMIALSLAMVAQTPEQAARIQEIKTQDTKYLWAESTSLVSNADAFTQALIELGHQSQSFIETIIDDNGQRYDAQTIIKSAAAFNNVSKIEFTKEAGGETNYTTFVYISKADYQKQMQQAEANAIERIETFIEDGIYQESRVNIADALRNFSWAMQLAKQFKYNKKLEVTDNRAVQLWLDDKVKSILESLEVVLATEKVTYDPNDYYHYTVNLMITYADRPVSNLDITYFNNETVHTVNVKNGQAALKYPNLAGQNEVSVNIRYCYDNPDEIEDDIERAFKSVAKPSYDRFNKKKIPVIVNTEMTLIKADAHGDWSTTNYEIAERSEGIPARVEERYDEVERVFIDASTEGAPMLKAADAITEALKSRDYKSVYQYFTPEALAKFQMMTNTGEISVSMDPEFRLEKATHYVRCTSIPVSVKNGKHSRNENIVLRFEPNSDKISSIGYALTENAENDIFRSADWMMDSRYAIVKFMEDYQTAYTTKDRDYLDMIFNGDAIIITGSVDKKHLKDKKFMQKLESNESPLYVKGVLYQQFTKDAYLENLARMFNKNKYIHLKYHDAVLTRAVTPASLSEAFWIQLKQDFNSSNYNDKGFLTLQVGMKPEGSQIYVRTWTPNRVSLTQMKSLFPLDKFQSSL